MNNLTDMMQQNTNPFSMPTPMPGFNNTQPGMPNLPMPTPPSFPVTDTFAEAQKAMKFYNWFKESGLSYEQIEALSKFKKSGEDIDALLKIEKPQTDMDKLSQEIKMYTEQTNEKIKSLAEIVERLANITKQGNGKPMQNNGANNDARK